MEETEVQESVEDEIATQEPEAHVEPEDEHQEAQEETQPEETAQEKNWREIRRRKKELEDTVRMQKELIDELKTIRTPPEAPEVDEIDSIGDEEYIPKGKVSRLAEKKAEAMFEKKMAQYQKQQDQSQFLEKLKRQYSDFSEIVTPETLALLEEKEPELAQTIADAQDPYKIGVQSYKYIKALGLVADVPTKRRVKEVEKRLEKNSKTVQSPQAFDKRPMAEAYRMSSSEKNKLYEEMMGYASQAGSVY